MKAILVFVIAFVTMAGGRVQAFDFGACRFEPKKGEGFGPFITECRDNAEAESLRSIPESAARVWWSLGQLYHFDRQYEKAVDAYTASLRLESKWPLVLTDRGDAYAALGKTDLAKADYAKAELYLTSTPDVRARRCWKRALRGDPLNLALDDCDKALAAMPDNAPALLARCLTHYRMNDFAAARVDCDAAAARDGKLGGAFYVGSLAKRKLGAIEGADADLAKALAVNRRTAEGFAIFGVK